MTGNTEYEIIDPLLPKIICTTSNKILMVENKCDLVLCNVETKQKEKTYHGDNKEIIGIALFNK